MLSLDGFRKHVMETLLIPTVADVTLHGHMTGLQWRVKIELGGFWTRIKRGK